MAKKIVTKTYAASIAVKYAMAQVGKRYVFGGSGPDAFDCSGLTMAAWKEAGLKLPHNANQQARNSDKVTTVKASLANKRKLQPGDLVFYYNDFGHVAMYVGFGKKKRRYVAQATDEKHGVEYLWMFQYAKPIAYGYVNHQ